MTSNIILLYLSNRDEHIIQLAEKTAKTLNYRLKALDIKALSQSIGCLMQLKDAQQNKQDNLESAPYDMLVFPSMPQDKLLEISTAFKESGVQIERKAMLTEHNRDWTMLALMQEIEAEHQYFMTRHELQTLIMNCMKLDQKRVDSEFQSLIMHAYDLLQNPKSTKVEFDTDLSQIRPKYDRVIDIKL